MNRVALRQELPLAAKSAGSILPSSSIVASPQIVRSPEGATSLRQRLPNEFDIGGRRDDWRRKHLFGDAYVGLPIFAHGQQANHRGGVLASDRDFITVTDQHGSPAPKRMPQDAMNEDPSASASKRMTHRCRAIGASVAPAVDLRVRLCRPNLFQVAEQSGACLGHAGIGRLAARHHRPAAFLDIRRLLP